MEEEEGKALVIQIRDTHVWQKSENLRTQPQVETL